MNKSITSIQWRYKGGHVETSAPGRSSLGAPNWGRNVRN